MPSRPLHLKVLLVALSALVLSGCVTSIPPARFLPRPALASVTEVALAVGDTGLKHHAWSECAGSGDNYTCVLVYTRTATGGVLYSHTFIEPIGTFVRHPDVAVTSSGEAYVVRSVCTDVLACVDYWSMFPADPDGVFIDTQRLHSSELPSLGPPRVEARGNIVFAAYLTDSAGDLSLRYRQLSGGARQGLVDTGTVPLTHPSLAIDSGGDLHAVWVRDSLADTLVAYANNKGAPAHFNPADTFDGGSNHVFTQPDLALDDDNRAYLAYAIDGGAATDTIRLRCLDIPAECSLATAMLDVPQVDGPWDVWRNVNLEMIGPRPHMVFAATHDSLTHSEVWWHHPLAIGDPPTRVTNTINESEAEPRIVVENSTAGDVPVIGWRTVETVLLGTEAADANFCYGDVFVMYNATANTRHIFEDQGTCDNAGFDLAANGTWVAGDWTDAESDLISAHAAWTAFNALLLHVPVVTR